VATASFGTLQRIEGSTDQWHQGAISGLEYIHDVGVSAAVGVTRAALTGVGLEAAAAVPAGWGLVGKFAADAGIATAERFGHDVINLSSGEQQEFSSAGTYAITALFGGVIRPGVGLAGAAAGKLANTAVGKVVTGAVREGMSEIGARCNHWQMFCVQW
jgi:hypothetical protein